MPPGDRLPDTGSGLEEDEVPLGDIPELDRGELRTDTLEFERVRLRVPKRRRGTRLIFSFVILLVIASGAWALWGDQITGPDPNQIPLVKAPDSPFKVRPEMPGGMPIPNRDKLVYNRLEKKTPERHAETLLPQPEQPLPAPSSDPPAAVFTSKTPNVNSSGKTERILQESKPLQPAEQAAAPNSPNSLESEKPKIATPPKSIPSASPQRKDQAAEPSTSQMLTTGATKEIESSSTERQLPIKPKKKSAFNATANANLETSFQIQLAAVREKSGAQREWSRLRGLHPNLLSKLNLNVIRADLGSKGVFYRLRAGPLGDQASAKALCQNLSKVKVSCIVVRPSR